MGSGQGYLFLFLGQGWVRDKWAFPPLGGFAYTFLISLGTLVAGSLTNQLRGVKGSGLVSPSRSDLIMNRGVLALERVQQVMWSVVVGLMFLFITVKTYASTTEMPTVPTELLMLMGVSSLGYVAGKAVRKPGPVIRRVASSANSLDISGENISATGARLHVDGVSVPGPYTLKRDDPTSTDEFVQGLTVSLPAEVLNGWAGKLHVIVLTNSRRAVFRMEDTATAPCPGARGQADRRRWGRHRHPGREHAAQSPAESRRRSHRHPERNRFRNADPHRAGELAVPIAHTDPRKPSR